MEEPGEPISSSVRPSTSANNVSVAVPSGSVVEATGCTTNINNGNADLSGSSAVRPNVNGYNICRPVTGIGGLHNGNGAQGMGAGGIDCIFPGGFGPGSAFNDLSTRPAPSSGVVSTVGFPWGSRCSPLRRWGVFGGSKWG